MKNRHKKGAPEGTPISHIDDTTPSAECHAKSLFDRIGTGRENAIPRPKNAKADRVLRQLIAEANTNGDYIINIGFGYYRPGIDDAPDFRAYCQSERHRAQEIINKVDSMESTYFGR